MKKYAVFFILIIFSAPIAFSWTGEVITRFDLSFHFPTGMTFDGKNIWMADYRDDKLYCINPQDGTIIRSIPSPAYWPEGLAWDGKTLWNADVKGGLPLSENYEGKIFQVDPANGNILRTISAPSSTPRGLAWDGKYLWCVDSDSDEIIQFSPDDGTTIRSLKSPAGDPRGLAYDGKYLWVSDRSTDELYMVDPETGIVIIVTESPGPFTSGLCFDGKDLWAGDYSDDALYKLKTRDGEAFRRSNPVSEHITYFHRITNLGPGKVNEYHIYIAVPENRPNQEITAQPVFSPEDYAFKPDIWGQQVAVFQGNEIGSGNYYEAVMEVNATFYDVRYFIYPEKVGTLSGIPADITAKFLSNDEKYQYDHPVIQSALREAVGDEKNPYWIAQNIYHYLHEKMYYEMVGGWNTAPTVLDRGNGSCSEYTFIYIAMCRAAGLPARYVGSVVMRGDVASMDDVFHRWVEVYIPGYGWIPVDPSGGDQESPRAKANYFGHVGNRYLITTQSGGGSEFLGWNYNSFDSWKTESKAFVVEDHFAEWSPADEDK